MRESSANRPVTEEIQRLFHKHGQSQYGGEAVSQLEHALQSAYLAEQSQASASLIVASLLHDVGHLLHDLPDDAPERGIDDLHETLGSRWLERHFGPEVVEPVRLHVAAKRYLCTVEPAYFSGLSEPSRISYALQGGAMSTAELREFERNPHGHAAVTLRRFDDAAKDVDAKTPSIDHFFRYAEQVAKRVDNRPNRSEVPT